MPQINQDLAAFTITQPREKVLEIIDRHEGVGVPVLTYPELLTKAVNLSARELGEPSFPDDVWQRERQRMVASIREANTRPATIPRKVPK